MNKCKHEQPNVVHLNEGQLGDEIEIIRKACDDMARKLILKCNKGRICGRDIATILLSSFINVLGDCVVYAHKGGMINKCQEITPIIKALLIACDVKLIDVTDIVEAKQAVKH